MILNLLLTIYTGVPYPDTLFNHTSPSNNTSPRTNGASGAMPQTMVLLFMLGVRKWEA